MLKRFRITKRSNLGLAIALFVAALSTTVSAQIIPTTVNCNNGYVSGATSLLTWPQGYPSPAVVGSSAPYNTTAQCTWSGFAQSSYILPADMTLTMFVLGGTLGPGSIGRISVAGIGSCDVNYTDNGFCYFTIPAGTDLQYLSVTATARAGSGHACDPNFGCVDAEAEVDIYEMYLQ